jgi:sodium-coupled neutral amino acid transporter 11
MAFYPARDAIQKTIGFETADRQPSSMQHYSVTVILFTIFLIFGMQIHSLGKVYSIVGGIASSFLAYIIPGFAYIAVFHPNWISKLRFSRDQVTQQQQQQEEGETLTGSTMSKINAKPTWWLDISSIVLVSFGLIVMSNTALNAFR